MHRQVRIWTSQVQGRDSGAARICRPQKESDAGVFAFVADLGFVADLLVGDQLEARLSRLDYLFPPGEDIKPIPAQPSQAGGGPASSFRAPRPKSDSDNISETGQAYDNAAETAAMLLEEKTLGYVTVFHCGISA